MTENMLEIAKHWEDHFKPKSQHHYKNRIVRAMLFTKLLQLFDQDKKLKSEAAIQGDQYLVLQLQITVFGK